MSINTARRGGRGLCGFPLFRAGTRGIRQIRLSDLLIPLSRFSDEAKLPPVETLFSSQDLGGWPLIRNEFLAKGAIFDQIRANSPT
ncbi:MAG UNVERIFIED_CONTAM: hypothetical protein LVR29_06720 [Microcystis novacekii LVE1205-3]|jgi:hypothetical protein